MEKTILHAVLLAFVVSICYTHPVEEQEISTNQIQGRQEEGAELAGVGTQVGQIVTGVFTANVGDIFKGTLPFIEDTDVQTGIGTIFEALTQPLNMLWAAGNKQTLKYFGITDPTTPNPLALANKTATGTTGTQQTAGTVPVKAVVPAPAVAVTEDPDGGEDGGEDNSRFVNPL